MKINILLLLFSLTSCVFSLPSLIPKSPLPIVDQNVGQLEICGEDLGDRGTIQTGTMTCGANILNNWALAATDHNHLIFPYVFDDEQIVYVTGVNNLPVIPVVNDCFTLYFNRIDDRAISETATGQTCAFSIVYVRNDLQATPPTQLAIVRDVIEKINSPIGVEFFTDQAVFTLTGEGFPSRVSTNPSAFGSSDTLLGTLAAGSNVNSYGQGFRPEGAMTTGAANDLKGIIRLDGTGAIQIKCIVFFSNKNILKCRRGRTAAGADAAQFNDLVTGGDPWRIGEDIQLQDSTGVLAIFAGFGNTATIGRSINQVIPTIIPTRTAQIAQNAEFVTIIGSNFIPFQIDNYFIRFSFDAIVAGNCGALAAAACTTATCTVSGDPRATTGANILNPNLFGSSYDPFGGPAHVQTFRVCDIVSVTSSQIVCRLRFRFPNCAAAANLVLNARIASGLQAGSESSPQAIGTITNVDEFIRPSNAIIELTDRKFTITGSGFARHSAYENLVDLVPSVNPADVFRPCGIASPADRITPHQNVGGYPLNGNAAADLPTYPLWVGNIRDLDCNANGIAETLGKVACKSNAAGTQAVCRLNKNIAGALAGDASLRVLATSGVALASGENTAWLRSLGAPTIATDLFVGGAKSVGVLRIVGGGGDPHLFGFNGEDFMFAGALGKTYNVLSHEDIQINGKLQAYRSYGNVEETVFRNVGIVLQDGTRILIDAGENLIDGEACSLSINQQTIMPNATNEHKFQGGQITWRKEFGNTRDMGLPFDHNVVAIAEFTSLAYDFIFYAIEEGRNPETRKWRHQPSRFIDFRLVESKTHKVPHGVFGQTASTNNNKKRNVDGSFAIEGEPADYEVSDVFATDFKFNKFNH